MRVCLICRRRNMERYGICPECEELNRQMRETLRDMSGRFACVTGGRIKIGYAVCLRLLRQGASVIAVTRYPKTALENYMNEPDYDSFKDRLYIIGFDLMRVDRIGELVGQIEGICGGLDILINNAAQTVKKSADYYAALDKNEKELLQNTHLPVSSGTDRRASAAVSERLHIFYKTVNVVDGGSYGGGFCPVVADKDKITVLFKRIQRKGFLPDPVNVVRHIGAYISPKDDITVVAHAQIINCDGKIIQVFVKDSAVSGIAGG